MHLRVVDQVSVIWINLDIYVNIVKDMNNTYIIKNIFQLLNTVLKSYKVNISYLEIHCNHIMNTIMVKIVSDMVVILISVVLIIKEVNFDHFEVLSEKVSVVV